MDPLIADLGDVQLDGIGRGIIPAEATVPVAEEIDAQAAISAPGVDVHELAFDRLIFEIDDPSLEHPARRQAEFDRLGPGPGLDRNQAGGVAFGLGQHGQLAGANMGELVKPLTVGPRLRYVRIEIVLILDTADFGIADRLAPIVQDLPAQRDTPFHHLDVGLLPQPVQVRRGRFVTIARASERPGVIFAVAEEVGM